MFDGLEIDMLSLGNADCIVVTQWTSQRGAQRILIDGGNASDYPVIKEFFSRRGMTEFWAVVCTHLHGDHVGGLIRLVQDRSIKIYTAWMHDIRNHHSADALRRASTGSSSQAAGVKEVLENTEALAAAFADRNITPGEPFADTVIAGWPAMTVLGPSIASYQKAITEFTGIEENPRSDPFAAVLSGVDLGRPSNLSSLLYGEALRGLASSGPLYRPPAPAPIPAGSSPFEGALRNSSVEKKPTTQPFNNTSAILGVVFNGQKLLFTADAGSESLDAIPSDWKSLSWMQVPHHGSDGNLSQANIERLCPQTAYISAGGDKDHPDKAIVNGLIKVRAEVFSTHTLKSGHLWNSRGSVPLRPDYGAAVPLKGTADPVAPDFDLLASLLAVRPRS